MILHNLKLRIKYTFLCYMCDRFVLFRKHEKCSAPWIPKFKVCKRCLEDDG